jgi:hypothetical protein
MSSSDRIWWLTAVGVTPKQPLAANVFERSNLVADGGRRDAEFGRGFLEAHAPGGSFERAQRAERRKLSHPFNVDEFISSSD